MDIRPMGTFRRFETAERVDLSAEEVVKRLEKRRFLPLDAAASGGAESSLEESERFGWITLVHLFDTRFTIEKVFQDPYAAWALRIDKRKIPQALVKAHLKIREIAHEEATGKRVGPKRRKELREEVKRELASKVLPASTAVQVVWNPNAGIVWLGNASEAVAEKFVRQFEDTFDVTLIPQTPRHLGLRLLGGDAEAIERVAASVFSKESPAGAAGRVIAAARSA
jgi:DNA recombination-dependent growth factor C